MAFARGSGKRFECGVHGALTEKQSALAEQFLQVVKGLLAKGAKTIHLIIAAPNSVVFNLGRIYDRRLLPSAIVYQYERSWLVTEAYDWLIVKTGMLSWVQGMESIATPGPATSWTCATGPRKALQRSRTMCWRLSSPS
nr:SAVED domain-containing protein [Pseudomonas anuradhapurensis]